MSDQSSESSEEWVLLNGKEEEISLESAETSQINLEINYDSVCLAAAESIKSSLCSEELEWEYDRLEGDCDQSAHDFLQSNDLVNEWVNGGCAEGINHIEDIDLSTSTNKYEEDTDLYVASVSKIQCYKHNRNDRLNFILNIMLALAISSAVGLGTGHFLGWSHKCQYNLTRSNVEDRYSVMPIKEIVKQNMDVPILKEIEIMNKTFPEKLSDVLNWDPRTGRGSNQQEACEEAFGNDNIVDNISETSIVLSTDVLPLVAEREIVQSNFSDSQLSLFPNVLPQIDWDKISHVAVTVKNINEQLSNLEEAFVADVHGNLNVKEINIQRGLHNFEQLNEKVGSSENERGLTNQLHNDLNTIIQTLSTIVYSQVSDDDKKYSASSDLNMIIKLYSDFQNIINTKISFIEDFTHSMEYKKYPKFSIKHLQKMVYSLIDSVDYLMKMSIKTLSKDYRKLNTYKFSKSISKIIFNFDRKWEKNQKIWSENLGKAKAFEYKEKSFNKEARHLKKKVQFEKDPNKKYKRYSMKS